MALVLGVVLASLPLASLAAAQVYARLAGVRCPELQGEYPVGSVGQPWDGSLLEEAQTLCSSETACMGVMRYVGSHADHCRDWCGRPQFCVALGQELTLNSQWVSYVKAELLALPALGESDSGAPLAGDEHFRQVACGGEVSDPVVLVSAGLLAQGGLRFPGACKVVYRPFSAELVNEREADGILSEAEEKDLPVFSAASADERQPRKYFFDRIFHFPVEKLGFQAAKRHLLSVFFLSMDSFCPGPQGESMFPQDAAANFSYEHVYIEDGTHRTREAAFKHYHFTLLCGDFKAEPFPPLALVYSLAYVAHAFAPEFVHWKASRLLFHLPDAAQGFKTLSIRSLERYVDSFLHNPAQEKVMTFKETFSLLSQQLLWYRYREPARRRAETAACALCDARARELRRSAAPEPRAAVAVVFCGMSRRSAHELRQVVRETWGQALMGPSTVQRFFVGRGSGAVQDAASGDVVELPVPESYRTLNLKAFAMLSWAHTQFPHLQWLVRHDDDVYLRADALMAQLAVRPPVRYYWGMFDHGSSPVRDPEHQHFNSYEQFPEQRHPAWGDIFPPYARGLLWAMSVDLLGMVVAEFVADVNMQPAAVLDESTANQLPHPDDPAVGVVVANLVQRGISVNLDDRDLNSFSLNPSCNSTFSNIHNRTWVVHHVKPETMRCMWALDTAEEATGIASGNSAIDASQRLFPDLCLCSTTVEEEEEEPDPDGLPFWYDKQRFNTAR